MKKLPSTLMERIENLRADLEKTIKQATQHFEERSESWQSSSKGDDYSAWLDHLQEVHDVLQDMQSQPGEE